jgi:universal stress protein E
VYADLNGLADRGVHALERDLQRRALERLEGIADPLRKLRIKVTVSAQWDFPAYEAIVRRALRVKADLIVASGHAGRHRFAALLRLTDWELVRLSPMAVLLVKAPQPYRHPVVLAAVDPSHAHAKPLQLDRQLLRWGQTLSHGLRGSLHAVHAYPRVRGDNLPEQGITPALLNQIEQDAQRSAGSSFDRILRTTRISRSRRYLIARDPVDAIVQAARRSGSAMVIMGAVSRSGLKRLLIGNTAERVLDQLSCDILVVKPPKFRNRVPRATRGARLQPSLPSESLGNYY